MYDGSVNARRSDARLAVIKAEDARLKMRLAMACLQPHPFAGTNARRIKCPTVSRESRLYFGEGRAGGAFAESSLFLKTGGDFAGDFTTQFKAVQQLRNRRPGVRGR